MPQAGRRGLRRSDAPSPIENYLFCNLQGYCTRLIVLDSTTTQKRSRGAKEQPSRASMKSSRSESRHGTHIEVLQTPEPAIAQQEKAGNETEENHMRFFFEMMKREKEG